MKKLFLSLIILISIFTWSTTAEALDLRLASFKVASNPVDTGELTTASAEVEAIFKKDFNGLGPIGTNLSFDFSRAASRNTRIEYDMSIFVEPKKWLRVGIEQYRRWSFLEQDSYTLVNRGFIEIRFGF